MVAPRKPKQSCCQIGGTQNIQINLIFPASYTGAKTASRSPKIIQGKKFKVAKIPK